MHVACIVALWQGKQGFTASWASELALSRQRLRHTQG